MNPSILVQARGLTKHFAHQMAVDHIDFEVREGGMVGFLGPNGAGKTTTIRMILNLLVPTEGELLLFGQSYQGHRREILERVNASSGTLTLPGKLTVAQNLRVFADMYGLKQAARRIEQLTQRFDLAELRDRPLYALSTGQQVRVSLCKAFLNKPRLLLLDEPTASLDPEVAGRVRQFLMDLVREEGTTVFVTSHNMTEVEEICSRVLFINHGRIIAEGTPRELARRVRRVRIEAKFEDGGEAAADVESGEVGAYVMQLVHAGKKIKDLSVKEPNLEDFFVEWARGGKE